MPIKIILTIIFALAIGMVIWRYRKHEVSWQTMVLWLVFWLAGIVVVIVPDATFRVARVLGVQRGADVVIYGAMALVFFLVFRMLLKIERLQREITILNREISLLKLKQENKNT